MLYQAQPTNGNVCNRRICVHEKNSDDMISVSTLSVAYDTLCYPFLFHQGRESWGVSVKKDRKITVKTFYSYFLFDRPGVFNPFIHSGSLSQQFWVDVGSRMETNNLNYHIFQLNGNNKKRTTKKHLTEAVRDKLDLGEVGKKISMASTYVGGPKYMRGQYMDAMTIVSRKGFPSLFITMTCNPRWPEIVSDLGPNETYVNRPDVVARVFEMYRKKLHTAVTKRALLGVCVAWMYVIEFQKRGLPHMHLLVVLDKASRPKDADDVDCLVCAEIPDQEKNPKLYKIITEKNIHKCTAFCKQPKGVIGHCKRGFPKGFRPNT